MTHSTQTRFGYPQSLIKEYDHWCVVLREQQPTLGSLVLICKQDVTNFSDISQAAFNELKSVTTELETGLTSFRPYQKINYLMLMMVDPHVHFHVIPRYDTVQSFNNVDFADAGWPAVPQLGENISLENNMMTALLSELKNVWPQK